jgi:hypothetical protein
MSLYMKLPLPNVLIPILAVIVVVATVETALARPKKHRVERPPQPALIQEEHGTPIIMQGLEWPKRPARSEDQSKERAERPRTIPRGSSTYMPPVPAPGVPSAIAPQPSVGVYKPRGCLQTAANQQFQRPGDPVPALVSAQCGPGE